MYIRSCMASLAGLALLAGTPGRALAQDPARIAFETYTLPNGLKVILAPDRSSQVVGSQPCAA